MKVGSIFRSGFFRLIIICLAGAIFCLAFGAIEYSDSKKTPIDINTLTKDDIKAGVVVEGDIYYNFGVCETIESTRNGRTESTTYRYVIPLSDDTLFTISIVDSSKNQPVIAQLDKQTDETYDVLSGTLDDTTTTVHVKGKISKMGSEDYGYYKDFLKSGDYTDDEIEQYGSEFYMTVKDFGQAKGILIAGVVFLALTVLFIFLSLKGTKNAPANASPYPITQSSFAQGNAYPQPGMPQPGMNQQAGGMPQPGMQQGFDQQMNPQMGQQFGQPQQPGMNQQFTQQPGMGQQPQQPGMPQPGVNLQEPDDPFSV